MDDFVLPSEDSNSDTGSESSSDSMSSDGGSHDIWQRESEEANEKVKISKTGS
jgi:hypothetical protein